MKDEHNRQWIVPSLGQFILLSYSSTIRSSIGLKTSGGHEYEEITFIAYCEAKKMLFWQCVRWDSDCGAVLNLGRTFFWTTCRICQPIVDKMQLQEIEIRYEKRNLETVGMCPNCSQISPSLKNFFHYSVALFSQQYAKFTHISTS